MISVSVCKRYVYNFKQNLHNVGSLVLTGVAWIRLANEKDQKVNDNEK